MNDSRRIPVENAASLDEIEAAINALTATDLGRIRGAARLLLYGLGPLGGRMDWRELYNKAILAFYRVGGRRWKKGEVDFVKTVVEAMRSIASHWKSKAAAEQSVVYASDVAVSRDKEGPRAYSIE